MRSLSSIFTFSALPGSPASRVAQEIVDTRIGKLAFESGYPSQETVQKLYDEMDFQRACQAYLWGIPAVGMEQWRSAHRDVFKAQNGQMLSYLDFKEKLGILTPNYTTPYIATLIDLQESGPLVVELPRGLMAGMIMDAWQRVLADLGVVGPDQGQGGKYLILPPGHSTVDPEGYYVVQSAGRTVFAGVRLLGADKEKEIREIVPGIKTYQWSPSGAGPAMAVRPAGDEVWSQMPPHGMAYWESLNNVIQSEPVMERDRLILPQLRFLGIEKGKPFNPDARQKKILEDAAVVGEAMAKANTSDKRVEPDFWPGTHWKHALVVSVDQRAADCDQFDERAAWFYEAVAVSKGMLTQTPGVGQRYIASYSDRDGNWLSGGNTYKLHVPPDPPVEQFWSVTAYDEGTRQMVVAAQGRPDLSSRKEDIVKNADGSIDVYFGPTAPPGKEANWIQTVPDKGWFAYFRFYAPTQAFFDKSWGLPDFEKLKG
ncbi:MULTISPECIES: DUF1254 domain-containing protein [unclassified Paraburkholderia]|uniref:DUF1254 domain-containing protein n=1 Tax=unclassified Paraburkholderia TaxID=2615204 RepID=UPI002AB605A5|nr:MULTISPECIES: DUF1254 domain-containing protein [unclassified Paraburkholderia]